MNAKQFGVAVVPIVVAEIVLSLAHQFLVGNGDNTLADWVLSGVSSIVFPFWAGARVARIERSWLWWCAGGLSVFLATVASIALSELVEPTLTGIPVSIILGSILLFVPVYALFGFLGGKLFLGGRSYGA